METEFLNKLQDLKEKEIRKKFNEKYPNFDADKDDGLFQFFRDGYLQSTLETSNEPSGNQSLTYLKANNETLHKVHADEPIFVLRAQDQTAPGIVLQWIALNMNIVDEAKIKEALHTALAMRRYENRRNPT